MYLRIRGRNFCIRCPRKAVVRSVHLAEVLAGNLERGRKIQPQDISGVFDYLDEQSIKGTIPDLQQMQQTMKTKYSVNGEAVDALFLVLEQTKASSQAKGHLLQHIM